MIHADIEPVGSGKFRVSCPEFGVSLVSDDPEHDICHALGGGVAQDGQIGFFRAGILTHTVNSLYAFGARRTTMGDDYPQSVQRRAYTGPARGDNT